MSVESAATSLLLQILQVFFQICDLFFGMTDLLLNFASVLFSIPLGLQIAVIQQLAGLLLNFSLDLVEGALDVVFRAGIHTSPYSSKSEVCAFNGCFFLTP